MSSRLRLMGRVVATMPARDRLMRLSLLFLALTSAVLMLATGSAPTLLLVAFVLAVVGVVMAVVEVGLRAAVEDEERKR